FEFDSICWLTDLAKLDNYNYFLIVKNTLESLEQIIDQGKHRGVHFKIQEIIEGTLNPEIENRTCDNRSFTISSIWFFECQPIDKIVEVRRHAISILDKLSQDDNPEIINRTVTSLVSLLHVPHGNFGKQIRSEGNEYINQEAENALAIIEKVISEDKFPTVTHAIKEKLESSYANYLDCILDKLDDVKKLFKTPDINERVRYCLSHDWPEFVRDEDHNLTDKKFNKLQEATALELWDHYQNDPKKIVTFIEDTINKLIQAGIEPQCMVFQRACAKVNPGFIPDIIKELLVIDDLHLSFSVGHWFIFAKKESKMEIALSVIAKGKSQHKRGLASVAPYFDDMTKDEIIDIAQKLSLEHDVAVKKTVAYNLGVIYRKCGQFEELKEIIANFDTGDDAILLDTLL
ncbi:unnamed protein product, partial [marine sediment metagenome]